MKSRLCSVRVCVCLAILLGAVLRPSPADARQSHWGVAASFTPIMKQGSNIKDLMGTIDLQGPELTVGIARGRRNSGDWAVSFLHKSVKDGSVVQTDEFSDVCGDPGTSCVSTGERSFTRGVTMTGLEARKSVVFVHVGRAEIGIDFAGGFATMAGDIETHEFGPVFSFDPATKKSTVRQQETVITEPASEIFPFKYVPLGRFHVAAGVRLSNAIKVRFSGGIGFPMNNLFTVTGVYFFGVE